MRRAVPSPQISPQIKVRSHLRGTSALMAQHRHQSRDDAGMPRQRRSPADLRSIPTERLPPAEQLDRQAALTLSRLLQPVAAELAAPHECYLPDCRDHLRQGDVAHDVDATEDTVSSVLNGLTWPNLHLLLAMLTSLEHQLVGHRSTGG
jgi:hypothetical protein